MFLITLENEVLGVLQRGPQQCQQCARHYLGLYRYYVSAYLIHLMREALLRFIYI